MLYLDNAATSWPKPEPVYAALESFLRTSGANPGRGTHQMAGRAAATIDDTRRKLAHLFGLNNARRVIFAFNATDALNLALKGILKPGDHAITTVMEHNSVRRPLRSLQDLGVEVTKVGADAEGFVAVDDIRQALRPTTRLIAMAHASNVNGALQPVEAVAQLAREHGTLLLIDAAQTAGSFPFTLDELGADLLAMPGHKGLMGPTGTGALILGERVSADDLSPVREGGTGGNSEEDVQPWELPARYEAGTLNTVGIAGLNAALDVVKETGVSAIYQHERELTSRLVNGLRQIDGLTVLTPEGADRRVAVVSFTVAGWEPTDFGVALDSAFQIACRTGLHCAPEACQALGAFPQGTIRFSPGYYTTFDEIDAAVNAVGELARAALQLPR